jgi:hypothetical protein
LPPAGRGLLQIARKTLAVLRTRRSVMVSRIMGWRAHSYVGRVAAEVRFTGQTEDICSLRDLPDLTEADQRPALIRFEH